MKKSWLAVGTAVCLLLSGCSFLLERSYSSIEPYSDRYWDSAEKDILRAESYQDLVNSLLMLIEQRSEEGEIRFYVPEGEIGLVQAARAKYEVCNETVPGAYFLENLVITVTEGESYCKLSCFMTYREGAQELAAMMALSDINSLVDLLRLAVREGHDSMTAQFISRIPCEEVEIAVEQLWQELYLDALEASGALDPQPPEQQDEPDSDEEQEESVEPGEEPQDETTGNQEEGAGIESGEEPEEEPNGEEPTKPGENSGDGEGDENPTNEPAEEPRTPVVEIPPCPWTIVFYPNTNHAEIVEIRLK